MAWAADENYRHSPPAATVDILVPTLEIAWAKRHGRRSCPTAAVRRMTLTISTRLHSVDADAVLVTTLPFPCHHFDQTCWKKTVCSVHSFLLFVVSLICIFLPIVSSCWILVCPSFQSFDTGCCKNCRMPSIVFCAGLAKSLPPRLPKSRPDIPATRIH